MNANLPRLVLKKGEEHRLLNGEFWIYNNEIASAYKTMAPGQLVQVTSAAGEYIATGYVNPRSTITCRLLSHDAAIPIDREFFLERIRRADAQRRAVQPHNTYYRMVYGEADFLPGLVIDRFDDYLIFQITTTGMEQFKETLFAVAGELYPGAVIVEKSITTAREKEGLEIVNRVVTPGFPSTKDISVNGLTFRIDFLKSQKTGFFLDQRDNYLLLRSIARDRDVLDVFSYAGAWGLHAHLFGARHVHFLEISGEYITQTAENIALNHFPAERFTLQREDAIHTLKEMSRSGAQKDLVILDPPAFVKARHKVQEALRGYKEINLRALKMLTPGGFLVTCSCSHFLSKDDFLRMVQDAARDAGRRIKLLEYRFQPYDHAVLLPLFQSDYLKCALFYVY